MPTKDDKSEHENAAIAQCVSRILASDEFSNATRLSQLLSYLAAEKIAGRDALIKESSIAVDVFKRRGDFDAGADPIVRVQMGRLRQTLAKYYAGSGEHDPVRAAIPKGRYVLRFTTAGNASQLTDAPPPIPVPDRRVSNSGGSPVVRRRPALLAVAAAMVLVLSFALMAWQFNRSPGPTLPERGPRLAIIPFTSAAATNRDDTIADELSFDLVTELARFRWLSVFVATQDSIASGRPSDRLFADSEDNADYTLRGIVRDESSQLHVNYQLQNVATGQVVWSGNFKEEYAVASFYDIQSRAATNIAVEIARPAGIIKQLETIRSRRQRTDNLSAYECTLKIYDYWQTFSSEDHRQTRACLESALPKDPDFGEAYAAISFIYLDEQRYQTNPRSGYDPLEKSLEMARKAVRLDPFSILAKQALFTAQLVHGNHDAFVNIGRQAIELSPNNPELLADFGGKLAIDLGNWREGLKYVNRALELNPNPAPWYYLSVAYFAVLDDNFERALAWSRRMNAPDWFTYHLIRGISFAKLGDRENVQSTLRQLQSIGISDYAAAEKKIDGWSTHPDLKQRLKRLLREAYESAQHPT